MNPIVQLIIQEAPGIIALIRAKHAAANPDAPIPTSEEVIAAMEATFASSLAKDQLLKAVLRAEL